MSGILKWVGSSTFTILESREELLRLVKGLLIVLGVKKLFFLDFSSVSSSECFFLNNWMDYLFTITAVCKFPILSYLFASLVSTILRLVLRLDSFFLAV